MRRIELSFLLVRIDGEGLKEVLVHPADQIFLVKALLTDLVDLVNERLERLPFDPGFREKLRRKRTTQARNSGIKARSHLVDRERKSGAVGREEALPAAVLRQIEHPVALVEGRQFKEALLRESLGSHVSPDLFSLANEFLPDEFQEHKRQDHVAPRRKARLPSQNIPAIPQHILELQFHGLLLCTFRSCHLFFLAVLFSCCMS